MQCNDTWNETNVAISTINFNKKLMELLCEDDNGSDDDNCCLISGDTLEPNHIALNCKHTFNYQQIFQEIKHQKKNNQLETTKLKTKQIKCPYCREVQDGLLPWKQGYDKVKYVNWPVKLSFKPNKCNHIMKSGKRKGDSLQHWSVVVFPRVQNIRKQWKKTNRPFGRKNVLVY